MSRTNKRCPCGSGEKARNCCLEKPPGKPNHVPGEYDAGPEPSLPGNSFIPRENMEIMQELAGYLPVPEVPVRADNVFDQDIQPTDEYIMAVERLHETNPEFFRGAGRMLANNPAMLLFYVGAHERVKDWIEHG